MWQEMAYTFFVSSVLVVGLMTTLWVFQTLIQNMGIVDIGWAVGIWITALTAFTLGQGDPVRKTVLLTLITLWAARLSLYLIFRFSRKTEDPRYETLRHKWHSEWKILAMFWLQGLLILLLSLPFYPINEDPTPSLGPLEWIGALLSLLGITGETIADWQLTSFKRQHPHKLCRQGLWNRSRHPNYFFEWLVWVGIALFALPSPYGLVGLLSCALVLYLLLFLSGIPMTEKRLLSSKGKEYRDYINEVPGFIPKLW